jgi:hypothetical protein
VANVLVLCQVLPYPSYTRISCRWPGAEATLRTLRDPALNQQLRTAGRAWVSATYGWRSVYQAVDAVYARLLAPRTASQARGST